MSIPHAFEGAGVRGCDASRASGINDSAGFGFNAGVDDAWRIYIDVGDLEISDKSV
jgi:hypothetical protein